MTTSAQLVDLSVFVLRDVGMPALGIQIFSPGDWPSWDGTYPYVRVSNPHEDKTSLGNAAIEFDVVATIRFTARVQVPASGDDGGAGAAESALGLLKQQIEMSIINHTRIMPLLEQYPFVRAQTGFTSEGEKHLGELVLDIGMKFYQGPEDFFVPRAYPLTDIRFESALPDPAASNGLLPGPVLDVQPPK